MSASSVAPAAGTAPIDQLASPAYNAEFRVIDPEHIAALAASGATFGDLAGITWNETTGNLVAGNQRMRVLREAGVTEWVRTSEETGYVEDPRTTFRWPVRIVRWSEERERLANLVANSPEMQGTYTVRAVAELARASAEAEGVDLRLTELQTRLEHELRRELAKLDVDAGKDGDDDAAVPPAVPVTQVGDLWKLGEHRLICGDSRDQATITRLMNGERAVLMATDPPYGVDATKVKSGVPVSGLGDRQERWGDIANDALSPADLRALLDNVLSTIGHHLVERPAFYVWHPSGELNEVFRAAMKGAGVLIHRQIIWVKPRMVMTRSGQYHWQHEPCFYGWRQGFVPPWYGEKNQTSVWHVGKDDGLAVHPTQKPVELYKIPMRNHTRRGEICLDPFAGSGSAIVAAERLGRRAFGCELEPRWCDAIVARWERVSGGKAARESAP